MVRIPFARLVFVGDVPPLNPLSRPGCFAEECETGFHAGVVEETADRDAPPHLGPPMPLDQLFDDGLKRDPVQRIAWVRSAHERMANDMGLMAEDDTFIAYSIERERGATGLSFMAKAEHEKRLAPLPLGILPLDVLKRAGLKTTTRVNKSTASLLQSVLDRSRILRPYIADRLKKY